MKKLADAYLNIVGGFFMLLLVILFAPANIIWHSIYAIGRHDEKIVGILRTVVFVIGAIASIILVAWFVLSKFDFYSPSGIGIVVGYWILMNMTVVENHYENTFHGESTEEE